MCWQGCAPSIGSRENLFPAFSTFYTCTPCIEHNSSMAPSSIVRPGAQHRASGLHVYFWHKQGNRPSICSYNLTFFFRFIYLVWERDRASRGGAERKREREREKRENPKQAPCWQHGAWFWARTHKLWDSWPEPKSRVRYLTDWATRGPL